MSKRYPGGVIRQTPDTPTQASATGVWNMTDVTQAQQTNNWPVANVPNPMSRSLRFRSSASAYLNRTPSVSSSSSKYTISMWVKLGAIQDEFLFGAGSSSANQTYIRFYGGANQAILWETDTSSTFNWYVQTSAVYRDPSAWYHLVFAYDSSLSGVTNQAKIYVNGVQATIGSSGSVGTNSYVNTNVAHYFGRAPSATYFDGYMSEVNLVDGQALAPTAFGQYDQFSNWTSKQYTGTYGTNGFYLPFKNYSSTGTLGLDYSGNNNTWTTNNFSVTAGSTYDSMTDVPTQWTPYNVTGDVGGIIRGNYCTLNPLFVPTGGTTYFALTNGNLTMTGTGGTNSGDTIGTMSSATGKFYYEFTITASSGGNTVFGACDINQLMATTTYSYIGYLSKSYSYRDNGNKQSNNIQTAYGASFGVGDIISVALDCDNGAIYFAKNGVWQASGVPTSGASKTNAAYTWTGGSQTMVAQCEVYQTTCSFGVNFGQYAFSYAPPSGYKSLCTTNLPTPTIQQGNLVMDATTYTGTSATQVITNTAGFKPDFAWFKSRNAANEHIWVDSVRGVNQDIYSSLTNAEATVTDRLLSFNSNGVTVGVDTGRGVNYAGQTQVLWQWQAGQGTTSTNTSGTITSTVSVNPTAGFSVVTWTGTASGATVGHGLGVAPKMIIIKNRSSSTNWPVWQTSYGGSSNTDYQYLNTADSKGGAGAANNWNNTAPTSSVISVGDTAGSNGSGASMVAYCWSEVSGYSKFGSYTGNGSADGTFVYTGFRPKYVLIKRSDSSNDWLLTDSVRVGYNGGNNLLWANLSNAEYVIEHLDLVSNGFKIRTTNPGWNGSGGTYIYMAFAEYPFKSALAR